MRSADWTFPLVAAVNTAEVVGTDFTGFARIGATVELVLRTPLLDVRVVTAKLGRKPGTPVGATGVFRFNVITEVGKTGRDETGEGDSPVKSRRTAGIDGAEDMAGVEHRGEATDSDFRAEAASRNSMRIMRGSTR